MPCSLASLFHLAPSAAQFEPDLFSKFLPTLHQPNTLVMSLYIRTGLTDAEAKAEKFCGTAQEAVHTAKQFANKITNCEVGLEQEYLSNNTSYSQVVWMVVTDSHFLKHWVPETYDSRHVSRASRDPSTAEVAEFPSLRPCFADLVFRSLLGQLDHDSSAGVQNTRTSSETTPSTSL